MPAKAAKKKNLSAIKRIRQAQKRNLRNASIRSKIKTVSKRIEEAITEKNQENVALALEQIQKFKPELIIASDDGAVKYLVVPHFKGEKIPVVFCGRFD